MLRYLIFAASIVFFSVDSKAIGLMGAKLLSKSQTERSIELELGELDGLKEGSFGQILIQRGTLDRPVLFLVGMGRVVKVFPNKSIWYMQKNYIQDKLVIDENVLLILDQQVLIGRENKYQQKQIVFDNNEYSSVDEFLEKNSNNVPDKYIKDQSNYEQSSDLFVDDNKNKTQTEIITYSNFSNAGTTHVNDEYNSEIKGFTFFKNNKVRLGDIKLKEDLDLLESDTKNLIEKINSQKFGLSNGLYKDDRKNIVIKDLSEKITINSVYEQQKQDLKDKKIITSSSLGKIRRDKAMWSADMEEKELRKFFVKSGLMAEKERRERAINELEGHEIILQYAGNINTHVANQELDKNYQSTGHNLEILYDLHLSKINNDYKNWSIQFLVEKGIGYYDLNNINGKSDEGQVGSILNYYFLNNPLTLNNFIGLIGIGMKVGKSTIKSDYFTKEYDYQLMTLPTIQLMTKYRFRAGDLNEDTTNVGISINTGLMYEKKNLKIVNKPSDNINSSISANDFRYVLGFSFYF